MKHHISDIHACATNDVI